MIIIIQLINRDMCVRWNIHDKIHFKCTVRGAEKQILGICFKNSIPRFFFFQGGLLFLNSCSQARGCVTHVGYRVQVCSDDRISTNPQCDGPTGGHLLLWNLPRSVQAPRVGRGSRDSKVGDCGVLEPESAPGSCPSWKGKGRGSSGSWFRFFNLSKFVIWNRRLEGIIFQLILFPSLQS